MNDELRHTFVTRLEEVRAAAMRLDQPHVALQADEKLARLLGLGDDLGTRGRAFSETTSGYLLSAMDNPNTAAGKRPDFHLARALAFAISEAVHDGTPIAEPIARLAEDAGLARISGHIGEEITLEATNAEPADA
ncbi:hypothetical protein ACSBOB_20395 [Mesorhizobium sp. ASY16-5R]|uniref:hypothetical protein n=1 Tax=Mesorhizobium sp. ASY16-5R TaxID=3445772 RepID=UPI003F9F823A